MQQLPILPQCVYSQDAREHRHGPQHKTVLHIEPVQDDEADLQAVRLQSTI